MANASFIYEADNSRFLNATNCCEWALIAHPSEILIGGKYISLSEIH